MWLIFVIKFDQLKCLKNSNIGRGMQIFGNPNLESPQEITKVHSKLVFGTEHVFGEVKCGISGAGFP